jgi:hypothetical protein
MGAFQVSFLERRNPTHSLGAFAGFERMKTLPYLTVTVGIIFPVIDACFIDIHNLTKKLCI